MANRYANLPGGQKIGSTFKQIDVGFDRVQQDVDELRDETDELDRRIDTIISDPSEGKDAELVDIRTPASGYVPEGSVDTAGGMTRDMQRRQVVHEDNILIHRRIFTGPVKPVGAVDGDIWLRPSNYPLNIGVKFNGTSSYIDISNAVTHLNNAITDKLTLEVVTKAEDLNNLSLIGGGYKNDGTRYSYVLRSGKDGEINLAGFIGNQSRAPVEFSEFEENKKRRLSLVWDGTKVFLYIDGNLVVTNEGPITSVDNISHFDFGRDSVISSRYLKGTIYDIRIWNVARTQNQIDTTKGIELNGDEFGLVGYWVLDEGEGDIAHDKTPYGNNGVIHNGEWVVEDD